MTESEIKDLITQAMAPIAQRLALAEARLDQVDGGKPDFEGPAPFTVCLVADPATVTPENMDSVGVEWDFGDPAGPYNRLAGPNAGHAYDVPGVYTATAKISGIVHSYRVKVTANDRRSVYLASDGDDSRDGSTEANRVKSLRRAAELAKGDRTQILIRAGDEIQGLETLKAPGHFFRLSTYGAGANAVIFADYAKSKDLLLFAANGMRNWTIERITFRTINPIANEQSKMPHAIGASGENGLIAHCEPDQVGYFINGNGKPNGVVVLSNQARDDDDLRAYAAWLEGCNWTIIGNRFGNSTREHIIRGSGGLEYVNIQGNSLENKDRRPTDPGDIHKSTINLQNGRMAYVANNTLRGCPVQFGPLGTFVDKEKTIPANPISERWRGVVFERNRVVRGQLQFQNGAECVTARDNLFAEAWGDWAINVYPYDPVYKRGVEGVKIWRNTYQTAAKAGEMIRIGAGAKKIDIAGNLANSPAYELGPYATAAVAVFADPAEVTFFGNAWATPVKAGKTPGIPVIVADKYLTAEEFKSRAPSDIVFPVNPETIQLQIEPGRFAGVNPAFLPPEAK